MAVAVSAKSGKVLVADAGGHKVVRPAPPRALLWTPRQTSSGGPAAATACRTVCSSGATEAPACAADASVPCCGFCEPRRP